MLKRRHVLTGAAAGVALGTRAGRAQAAGIKIGVLTDMSGVYRDATGPRAVQR